jgi:shikimate kinase
MPLILLTGPKHAGKSSAGRALAALYQSEFLDLDELISEQSGKSPRALYQEGADVFRRAEAAAIASLSAAPDSALRVAAAGGGLIDNEAALRCLTPVPRVVMVYLDVSAKTAWERIRAEKTLPPFLDTANPEETHRVLHERRAAAYRQRAAITIAAEGKSPTAVAEAVAGEIAARSKDAEQTV